MKTKPTKRFIVRKLIFANSAAEALRKDKIHRPDEVYLDDEWMKQHGKDLSSAIGFNVETDYYE